MDCAISSMIKKEADNIRKQYGINSYGIPDIFRLIEKNNCKVIRFPLGKDTICGFATKYEEDDFVFTNSSEILSREIFTAAHELAHIIYDVRKNGKAVIDEEIGYSGKKDVSESNADFFAAHLLCPDELLEKYLEIELKKIKNKLNGFDIVKIQREFNISYDTALNRLIDIKFINIPTKDKLKEEQHIYSSRNLFQAIGIEQDLIMPTNLKVIPFEFIDWVVNNYKNGFVPFESLEKAFSKFDIDTNEFKNLYSPEYIEEDIDKVFGGIE